MKEYATLTELMAGREPGSVRVKNREWRTTWFRPVRFDSDTACWFGIGNDADENAWPDGGTWLIVPEDAPALDTLRLEIASRVLAGVHANRDTEFLWSNRHAYALAEADALLAAARAPVGAAEARK